MTKIFDTIKHLTFLFSLVFLFYLIFQFEGQWAEIIILGLGLLLSHFDLKTQTYPLLPWLLVSLILSFFYPPNILTLSLLAIAELAYLGWIQMGEGDFLFLATCSLLLDLSQILWLMQISSLLGIGYYLLSGNHRKRIAFIPCLYLGLAILLFFI